MGRADTAFFVTGEPSGDRHSAPVVADLVQRGFSVRGVGGPAMRETYPAHEPLEETGEEEQP